MKARSARYLALKKTPPTFRFKDSLKKIKAPYRLTFDYSGKSDEEKLLFEELKNYKEKPLNIILIK